MKLNFKLLPLIFIVFFLFSSCKKEEFPYDLTQNDGIVGKWINIGNYDPYDSYDEKWSEVSLKCTEELEFSDDNSYIKRGFEDRKVYCFGKYSQSKPDTVLLDVNCQTNPIETRIGELTETILIMEYQGRHGIVRRKYRAIK
ncbi:hypothetical protein V9L05_08160 [Bernardetia sp. Wsw4-3y2]|uniref:hypothetical protein n=1 Tax=Bernardetia sp. Wsw4-3y2 TaxID=3127471 RepID=UPI0030D17286